MNVKQMAAFVGKKAILVTNEGLRVKVTITDVTRSYGHIRASIDAGEGEAKVNFDRLEVLE